jgi:hypothetical protein
MRYNVYKQATATRPSIAVRAAVLRGQGDSHPLIYLIIL